MKQKLLWPNLRQSSYAARRTALASFDSTRACVRLYRLLRDRFFYDDALYVSPYRLEYVMLECPQYRLYRGGLLIGVVDVHPERLDSIQRQLAAYLVSAYGFTVEAVTYVRRRTPINASKYKQPRLFPKSAPQI